MWGVCLDINAPDLFQTVVEYCVDKESGKAVILSPESACGSELESVKPLSAPPEFPYGARVSPAAHPEVTGSIARIFWHFVQERYYYKIEISGSVKSKRYFAEDIAAAISETLSPTDDKQLLIQKYGLKHEDNAWYSDKENSHKHLIFKDAFFERTDLIGLLFRINKLCMAKVKYFRGNIEKFEPMKYDYKKGFIAVPLWDADFLRHRASGYILDFSYLQTITVYDDFAALCRELESFE